MEGSLNKRLRERDETPPPSKKRCTQATPPTSAYKSNGASNGHAATHTELEALGRNGSARRSSRTSATSSTTSSPPASPARRGRRGAGGSSSSNDQPQTPTRSSGRLRQSTILASNISWCTFHNPPPSWFLEFHFTLKGCGLWLYNQWFFSSGVYPFYTVVLFSKLRLYLCRKN